ncbi:MAG: coproporphyrinogen III oxidase, partial [Allopontixanthobacter sp.]|nr:coproporphyrinogen III oxidase [Allopontixanthobacter sp.]
KLAAGRGIRRSPDDQVRGNIIEALLCAGSALLPPALEQETREALRAFAARGLADVHDGHLTITADGLPYARSIAALFDPYRQHTPRRFSSAV